MKGQVSTSARSLTHLLLALFFFGTLPSEDVPSGEAKHISRHFVGVKDAALGISGQCHYQVRRKLDSPFEHH